VLSHAVAKSSPIHPAARAEDAPRTAQTRADEAAIGTHHRLLPCGKIKEKGQLAPTLCAQAAIKRIAQGQ
jgi:hypothetical protein